MTWEIVLGIIALAGFLISLGVPIWKLANVLSRLESAVARLDETNKDFKQNSKEEHAKMHEQLDDHEHRIFKLECKHETHEDG